ncbi:hypothetical protein GCM10009764_44870 [Nocardia ninae]|uniref:Uncharacterized protein n=1 Tax=Nocardia ninae NBRC 108245 TaxID=1210091 RepID=A0A511MPE3_9NOCA|nr:hypothetical protein NN4_70010 [Nocardia ninae NBRC 108245]
MPPRSSTAIADCDASQWVDDTIPKVPRKVGLVVNISNPPVTRPLRARTGAIPCGKYRPHRPDRRTHLRLGAARPFG